MGEVIAHERKRMREHVRAEIAPLRAELEAARAEIAALKERIATTTGELPQGRDWKPEMVCYKGQLFACDGLWQARCDTATAPGGPDWTLLAPAGRDGKDGRDGESLSLRGTYDMHDAYARLDVVEFGGEAFIALRDNPGMCPGDGWQLLASRGAKGDERERGARGLTGETGGGAEALTIRSWESDAPRYRASPLLSNGMVAAMLELRPMFEQYLLETKE
jgi:hypothetical protein